MHAGQLSRSQQLGWAAGSLGTAVMLGVLTSYALFYMTTYLGIGILLAGQLIGLSKFFDLVTDPVMGQISDRTRSPSGRRRPYLLAGAIGCPVSIVLLFLLPDSGNELLLVSWLGVVLLLFAISFTLFNVPYLAMPAEMTTIPDERTLIMTQRIFFSTIGVLVVSTLGPQLINRLGGGAEGYIRMSWVMAGVVFAAMLLAHQATRHAKSLPASPQQTYQWRRQLQLIGRNRPFRFYLFAKIFMFMSQSAVQGSMLFFAFYVLERDESVLAAFGIGYTLGSVVSLPLWNAVISRAIGKRNAFRIAALGLGVVFLSWIVAGSETSTISLYVRFLLLGIFSAGSMIAGSAMLPDIMEYDRRQTGIHQEGLYAAAFSVVEKVANTVGPIIVGVLLGLTGFISSRDGELAAQPDAAILAIKVTVSIVPFVFALGAACLISFYDLADDDATAAATNVSE
jgi:GPH family glycoside/pentoside/hexuronide:cation symporter